VHLFPARAGFEPPPSATTDALSGLSTALDQEVPAKHKGKNLLIGTWNLR
jgi:hypothetical protein